VLHESRITVSATPLPAIHQSFSRYRETIELISDTTLAQGLTDDRSTVHGIFTGEIPRVDFMKF